MTTKATKATKAIVSLAATKAATKAPSDVVTTISNDELIELANLVGLAAYTSDKTKATTIDTCKAMYKVGVKLGRITATKTVKACPIIAAYIEGRFPDGKNRKGEVVDTATKAKYASYFKVAVESGKPYSEGNASKGAGDNIMFGFAKSADSVTATEKLLKGFNKMMEANSELATLAGFLIGALEGNASKSAGDDIMIGFAKDTDGKSASKNLLKGFNKMKGANEELAELAGFLIDALEDYANPE